MEYFVSFLNAHGYGKCIHAWLTWRFPQGCNHVRIESKVDRRVNESPVGCRQKLEFWNICITLIILQLFFLSNAQSNNLHLSLEARHWFIIFPRIESSSLGRSSPTKENKYCCLFLFILFYHSNTSLSCEWWKYVG